MIIAVTGFRRYRDGDFVRANLEWWKTWCYEHSDPLHIRVGDAEGADEIAARWCVDTSISHHVFHARRFASGALMLGAGPERNRNMLQGKGDRVQGPTNMLIGFPRTDGVGITVPGSGTWGAMIMASQMGIKVGIPAYTKKGA